jgi:hypothetical protein
MLLIVAATCAQASLYATDYYVKTKGSGTGASWTDAMDNHTFTKRLLEAKPGDVFHLAAGVDVPNLDTLDNASDDVQNHTIMIRDGILLRRDYDADGKPLSEMTKSLKADVEAGKQYDRPANIRDETNCMRDMPPVGFKVRHKIFNKDVQLDGFSIPLVGDLNGDGKPEIVGLGARRDDDQPISWLAAYGKSIVIYDGQTGDTILNFELTKIDNNKFNDKSGYGTRDGFRLRSDPWHNSYSHLAIADLDNDGTGEIVVAETGSGLVYALKPTLDKAKRISGLKKIWTVNVLHKAPYAPGEYDLYDVLTFGAPVPYVSDLNGDGLPEVIVYNKIYNARTGRLILELEKLEQFGDPTTNKSAYQKCKTAAYVGRVASLSGRDDSMPVMAINDIDDDGVMEIIAGSKIYKPKIIDPNVSGRNSFTVLHGPESVVVNNATYYLTDGFTVVADIDGDDASDVIVVKRHSDESHILIYVWDPRIRANAGLKAVLTLQQNVDQGHFSVPFVGDINGRNDGWDRKGKALKLPEICLTIGKLNNNNNYPIKTHPTASIPEFTDGKYTGSDNSGQTFRGHVVAFTYNTYETNISKRLQLSWLMKHSDRSHQTGIVMFDFDADGVNELVYRDELSLRVLSPAERADGYDFVNLAMNSETHPKTIRFRETGIASYTGFECPVIADVNGDGSADIITFALKSTSRQEVSAGYLFVYEASDESWAPSRPVWNQGIYYPLQINDNLTVPRRPQSTLTSYSSKLPSATVSRTIRPFNGNWIQQPIVRTNNYVPILLTPDPSALTENVSIVSATASTTKVRIKVENRGEASANRFTPVAFYHTSLSSKNFIGFQQLSRDVFAGESATFEYLLKGDYRGKNIYVRLVDNGRHPFPAQGFIDCNDTNNVAYAMQVTAVDDYVSLLTSGVQYIDVRQNDMYNRDFVPTIDIVKPARHGSASVDSSLQISYRPEAGFQGIDTVRYRIRCSDKTASASDEASVYITVKFNNPPKATVVSDTFVCVNKAITMTGNYPDKGNPFGKDIVYRWEFRHIDSANWTKLYEGESSPPLTTRLIVRDAKPSDAGYYRLRVGKRGDLASSNCCALSDSVVLTVIETARAADMRIQLSPLPSRTVRLTSFVDSMRFTTVRWENVAAHTPAFIDSVAGAINSRNFAVPGTYTYKYTARSKCDTSEARAYIRTVKNKLFHTRDTVVICRTHSASKRLNLNHILGVELGGRWLYDATVNPDATVANNVTVMPASSQYAGALIFNAAKAYDEAPSTYLYPYKGLADTKMFKFVYYPHADSGVTTTKELVLVMKN